MQTYRKALRLPYRKAGAVPPPLKQLFLNNSISKPSMISFDPFARSPQATCSHGKSRPVDPREKAGHAAADHNFQKTKTAQGMLWLTTTLAKGAVAPV